MPGAGDGHRSAGCPGGSAPADVVIAVSAPDAARGAVAADAAARRGARLVAVGAARLGAAGTGRAGTRRFISVSRRAAGQGQPLGVDRAGAAASPRGLVTCPGAAGRTARGWTPRPTAAVRRRESFVTRPRALALELAGAVPVVWGARDWPPWRPPHRGPAGGQRPVPGGAGALGEAGRGRVACWTGCSAASWRAERDIFADRAARSRGCGWCCCGGGLAPTRHRRGRRRGAPGRCCRPRSRGVRAVW